MHRIQQLTQTFVMHLPEENQKVYVQNITRSYVVHIVCSESKGLRAEYNTKVCGTKLLPVVNQKVYVQNITQRYVVHIA